MSDREKKGHGVAFWCAGAAVALMFLYPLSFGPVCWIDARLRQREGDEISHVVWASYSPFFRLATAERTSLTQTLVSGSVNIGMPEDIVLGWAKVADDRGIVHLKLYWADRPKPFDSDD